MTPEDISNHNFTPEQAPSGSTYSPSKIKVIGVGGGGNNAVNHMYNLGSRNVTFIVANTDRQALQNSPVPNRVLLGPNILRGRGAGNDPEKARKAAEESVKEIDALFDDETDMVFITAGMGGGTGTGASPVIASVARNRNILTIGIVTIPFLFEGQKKILKALEGAREMSSHVDALLVINNERLSEIYHDCGFLNAFGKADDILSMAAMSISEIVTCDGYINLDFNDVNTTLMNGGTAIISTGYGEGEHRVTKAIEDALHSPLLRNTDIFGSRKLLFNLYFSREAEDSFRIDETNEITSFISSIDNDVDIIWGVAFDESLGNKVKFTILAAGFEVTIKDDTTIKPIDIPDTDKDRKEEKDNKEMVAAQMLSDNYGQKFEEMQRIKSEQRYIILQPDELDDEKLMEALEQTPAYNRDKKVISSLRREAMISGKSASQSAAGEQKARKSVDFNDLG